MFLRGIYRGHISGASTYKVFIDDVCRDTSVCLFDLNDYIDIDENHDIDVSAHGNNGEFSINQGINFCNVYSNSRDLMRQHNSKLIYEHVSVTEQSYSKNKVMRLLFNISNLVSMKGCDYIQVKNGLESLMQRQCFNNSYSNSI